MKISSKVIVISNSV